MKRLYDFGYVNTFQVFKSIAAGKVRDENINFESHRTSLISEKVQAKQNPCYLQKFQAAIRCLAIKPTQQVS